MRYGSFARSSVILGLVLLVLPEPAGAAGVDCSDIPNTLKATYSLGSASARRGEEVTIPFSILANGDIQGFSVSVDFDEEVLEAVSVDMVYRNPEGGKWAIQILGYDNSNADPANSGIEEGSLGGAVIFSQTKYEAIPRDEETPVLEFRLRIREDTGAKTTELRFVDGARIPNGSRIGPPTPNVATTCGKNVQLSTIDSTVFVSGVIRVIDEIVIFVRGDSNADSAVDISDAVYTLGYLFLGGPAPDCLDAADANDDGELDVSDPVATIRSLLDSGSPLPAPWPEPGADPTSDSLVCIGR